MLVAKFASKKSKNQPQGVKKRNAFYFFNNYIQFIIILPLFLWTKIAMAIVLDYKSRTELTAAKWNRADLYEMGARAMWNDSHCFIRLCSGDKASEYEAKCREGAASHAQFVHYEYGSFTMADNGSNTW